MTICEPHVFYTQYRNYVSDLEKRKLANIVKIKNDIIHNTDYIDRSPKTYASVVKNSHQYPRWSFNPITPYVQKPIVGSALLENMDDEVVYFGSKKYTRKTCPRLPEHRE